MAPALCGASQRTVSWYVSLAFSFSQGALKSAVWEEQVGDALAVTSPLENAVSPGNLLLDVCLQGQCR